jgi:hypothetical protein
MTELAWDRGDGDHDRDDRRRHDDDDDCRRRRRW